MMNSEIERKNKLAWVEPKVVQLDVNETANLPGDGGGDGGSGDFSRS